MTSFYHETSRFGAMGTESRLLENLQATKASLKQSAKTQMEATAEVLLPGHEWCGSCSYMSKVFET